MGLSQALFSAISGLTNHQRRMDNIGNNLANVNTVGFKKGVHRFGSLLSQTLSGGTAPGTNRGGINPMQVGLGTGTSSINKNFDQGSLETTGNQRDMAIEGNGFFILRTGIQGVFGFNYTRDGSFYLGTDGKLLGGEGLAVQGYAAENGVIATNPTLGDLTIPIGKTGAAVETTKVGFTGNVNSDQTVALTTTITTHVGGGGPVGSTSGTAATDDTWWGTGAAGETINIGGVQTSAALEDGTGTDTAAITATTLQNLRFLRGTNLVQPFNNIDTNSSKQITISFRKGGRKQNATFTYGASPASGDGTTLGDLMTFLTGGVNDSGTNARLLGGAMGTTHIAARTIGGTAINKENAGAYMRRFRAGPPAHAQAVDFGGAAGIDNTAKMSIVSNFGTENAITNIEISYNNVNYTDMFAPDADYGIANGGASSTSMIVYDSLGNPKTINVQLALVNRDTNFSTWRWYAESTDDTDATWNQSLFNDVANPTTNINVGTGLIQFDQQGRFVAGSDLSTTGGISLDLDNLGVSEPIQIGITEGLSASQTQDLDFSSVTQVATDSDFNLKEQDGSAPGTLDSFTVTTDGIINGVFSNGNLEVQGQMALAIIPNENGLLSVGNNSFVEGASSGEPQIDSPQVGGRGSIRAGTLELSNVDLSEEFTNLVVTERGFQANAKVITTSDEMLVELVNLKR